MALTTFPALSAPRSALKRALVFASPVIGILFADKALKLAAAGRIDNIAPVPRTLIPLVTLLLHYWPLMVGLATLAIGLSLSSLLARRKGRTGEVAGWLLALPLGLATTALVIALGPAFGSVDAPEWASAVDEF